MTERERRLVTAAREAVGTIRVLRTIIDDRRKVPTSQTDRAVREDTRGLREALALYPEEETT